MRRPEVLRTMGAEYRADRLDLEDDYADRIAGRRIASPLLALWARGGLTERFGDPLAIWRKWAVDVNGTALDGGHFLMEGSPEEITALLRSFLTRAFRQEPDYRPAGKVKDMDDIKATVRRSAKHQERFNGRQANAHTGAPAQAHESGTGERG